MRSKLAGVWLFLLVGCSASASVDDARAEDDELASTISYGAGSGLPGHSAIPTTAGVPRQGRAVALSDNGNVAAALTWSDSQLSWGTQVSERTASGWSVTPLPNSTLPSTDLFGLAISGDGKVIVSRSLEPGSSSVTDRFASFVRTSSGWQAVAFSPMVSPGRFMNSSAAALSLSLSQDGSRLAVGGTGRVALFERSGTSWRATSGPTITSADPSSFSPFEFYGVALSGDGRTLAVAADSALAPGGTVAGPYGMVRVYQQGNGTTWTQSVIARPAGGYKFGTSVALSRDGATLLVGSSGMSVRSPNGTLHIFRRGAAGWDSGNQIATGYFSPGAADLSANGTAVAFADHLSLTVKVVARSGSAWRNITNIPLPQFAIPGLSASQLRARSSTDAYSVVSVNATGKSILLGTTSKSDLNYVRTTVFDGR